MLASPNLGRLVPHDSVGIHHNTIKAVVENFRPLGKAVHAANRSFWSSVEIFSGWPYVVDDRRRYGCDVVRTAPPERVIAQMKAESTLIGAEGLTCWEWHMYASPLTPGKPCPWNNGSFYKQYKAYVRTVGIG